MVVAMSIEIPNYRVVEKLGEGAQSQLYRARCMPTGKDYTVKIIKVARPEDVGFVELLKSEHQIGSVIDHPVIRKVYELRYIRQRLRVRGAYLIMEYVNGLAMSEKAFQRPLAEILALFIQVGEGLNAMHLAGWVHADIKPNNILVTPDGSVKLIDLGQSSKIREAKTRIQGTIDYIAPEQVDRGVLDQRTDVFGLAAALHRVLTGRAVATDMNQTASVHSQGLIGKRMDEIKHTAIDELPTCVARLIDDCVKKEPLDRLSDMPTVIERLRLAQTIVEKQAMGRDESYYADQVEADQPEDVEDTMDAALTDTILEDLGLSDAQDDSLDLDEVGPTE